MKLRILQSKYASNSDLSHKQHEKSYVDGSTFKNCFPKYLKLFKGRFQIGFISINYCNLSVTVPIMLHFVNCKQSKIVREYYLGERLRALKVNTKTIVYVWGLTGSFMTLDLLMLLPKQFEDKDRKLYKAVNIPYQRVIKQLRTVLKKQSQSQMQCNWPRLSHQMIYKYHLHCTLEVLVYKSVERADAQLSLLRTMQQLPFGWSYEESFRK